ncbi:MAG: O-antigen ligase family protein [Clostridiales bacterium]|nr:O-antigen ligase family protein [Clostridiales bacterium]
MRVLLFYLCLPFIVAIGVRRPFWCLAIYLSAHIIRPTALFWGQDTGMILFKVSIAGALLGFLRSEENKTEALSVREWWLALWVCLAMTASVLFADLPSHPMVWSYVGDSYRALILYWLILGILREKQQALLLIDILLLMAMLFSLWGWEQHFGGNSRLESLGGQGDSNMVASLGVLFLPLAAHKLFTAKERWQKIFGLDATILIAGMIIFTNSRSGFLGLAAASLYLLLISRKKIWIGICYFLVFLTVVPLLSDDYIARLNTIEQNTEAPEAEYSAGSRQVLWHAGWLIFKDHPIFGVGVLNFSRAKAPYRAQLEGQFDSGLLDYSFAGLQGGKVGHSTWFGQVLPEGGLFLAIPYSWLIVSFFWRSRRLQWVGQPPTEETRPLHDVLIGLEAGLFGYCLSMSFGDYLLVPFLTFHIMLGVQLIRIIERMEKATPPIISSHQPTDFFTKR